MPGDGAVSHALSGVTCRDVNIVGIARISTDEREPVDWFHTCPTSDTQLHPFAETFARPLFEPCESFVPVILLSGLVILTADDQNVVAIL
jgi:hypothetical protein